jgi:hypothetical protein
MTPELKSPCQITPINIFQKCHPWLEIIAKVGHFQVKSFRLFAVALRLFPPLDAPPPTQTAVALQKHRSTTV